MPRLNAAHYGYQHQDILCAYAFSCLLLPEYGSIEVTVDKKVVPDDRFDDIEIVGNYRRRIQVKSHTSIERPLRLADLSTDSAINFRIDRVIESALLDPNPVDQYCLFTTFEFPESRLLSYLEPADSITPLFPGIATSRFQLRASSIWPQGEKPKWRYISRIAREAFFDFCSKFVIEIGCPKSSGDLRSPGPLDSALLSLLHNRIGIGLYPNNNRNLADTAASLIYTAQTARTSNATLCQADVVKAIALQIDYGRVEEVFPVDERRIVSQPEVMQSVLAALDDTSRLVVTGPPGIGKSWFLHNLTKKLKEQGWLTVIHYCFIDLLDSNILRRVSTNTVFGSLQASIIDADPSIASPDIPRFAAGSRELQRLLDVAVRAKPDRKIALIVDGLDHADRLSDNLHVDTAATISAELADLTLPAGVVLITGSQPGYHLEPLLESGKEYSLTGWPESNITELAERVGVKETLINSALQLEVDQVVTTIVARAGGNPLYATYLARTAINLSSPPSKSSAVDIADYLSNIPQYDDDIGAYYRWLTGGLAREARWIADLLSLLDFPVSSNELCEIRSSMRRYIPSALNHLAPVLVEDTSLGGVRIYHESFQRYLRNELAIDPNVNVQDILSDTITWLRQKDFFIDTRAFRSLLKLLALVDDYHALISFLTDDFVSTAAAHGQPADAIFSNVGTVASIAAKRSDWPLLARCNEVVNAADMLYHWRFREDHVLAEQYGITYATLFSAEALATKLIYDGRCTFPPRPGILLCQLCDQQGVIPPWTEYLAAHERQRHSENVAYGAEEEEAINLAVLEGGFRVAGRERAISDILQLLISSSSSLPTVQIARALGSMYGDDSLTTLLNQISDGKQRAWVRIALAEQLGDPLERIRQAELALRDGLPWNGWHKYIIIGGPPDLLPTNVLNIDELNYAILTNEVRFSSTIFEKWLTALEIIAAKRDDERLTAIEACIPADTWFHRWLRFCCMLQRYSCTEDNIVTYIEGLARDIDPLAGETRVCDLFHLRDDFKYIFLQALLRLDEDNWCNSLDALADIASGTTTWFRGGRMSPFSLSVLFEVLLATADTEKKRSAASTLGTRLLGSGQHSSEFYEVHALDQLLLTRIHALSGNNDPAKIAWSNACRFLAGYGSHKDTTVYELLDPLDRLATVDPYCTRQCLHDIQPIVEGVLTHTDGKETNHAFHLWIDTAAQIHPVGALSYLSQIDLSKEPSFGDLDHAIPIALAGLEGHTDHLLLAACWMAIGSTARNNMSSALRVCEYAFRERSDIGCPLWRAVISSLEGDGVEPLSGLLSSVAETVSRNKLPMLPIGIPDEPDESEHQSIRSQSTDDDNQAGSFDLPTSASPLQIIQALKRWRRENRNTSTSQVAVIVGARLRDMLKAGEDKTVESIIRRIAIEIPSWDENPLLVGIAEHMVESKAARLAAITYTLAYTRTYGGWRHFGGKRMESFFLQALAQDTSAAWITLADEVADIVMRGGGHGVTSRLIELLVIGNCVDDAFATWNAACGTIRMRLPESGPSDVIDVVYDATQESPEPVLGGMIAARINHCLLHERRQATAAIALVAQHFPQALASGITLAVEHNAPPSTLITLLQIACEHEPEPYVATRMLQAVIKRMVASEYVSVRAISHTLLERIGINPDFATPLPIPVTARLPNFMVNEIVKLVGIDRIDSAKELWSEFPNIVAGRIDARVKSDEVGQLIQRSLGRMRLDLRKGRRGQAWLPMQEEAEREMQITGSAIRTALVQEGLLNPHIEIELGLQLLGNLDVLVRRAFSRTVRPTHTPFPSSFASGLTQSAPLVIGEGEYTDWTVIAYVEEELIVGSDNDKPVIARVDLNSGIMFADKQSRQKGLPLGYGQHSIWSTGLPGSTVHGNFRGPLAGYEIIRDLYGPVEILTPHPIVSVMGDLRPVLANRGFILTDSAGAPAIVCETWAQRYIADLYLCDREYRLEGLQLIVRPDVIDAVQRCGGASMQYAMHASQSVMDNDS